MAQDRAQLLITAVDQTRSAFDSIRGNLAKLGDESNRVKGLLAGLGVSLSAAGFAAMIKSALDAADQLNKLSQKIGISVEALSTLRFAAQLSDVSLETLQKGIKGLSQNITEANTGVGDGAQVFEALGISVKNADGSMKSTEAVLLQVADVFAHLEDGAVKTALSVKLFGKAGQDMIPFLNQGAAGINQLTAEAERLGLKLTTETARSAEAFNDNLTALKASSSSLGIALARDFLPELTNITNAMREAANEAGTLKALWVGLGGVGNLVFNGTEIKQARDEVARIQELVDSTRKKVETGRAPVPFMPFDIKFNDKAMATLKKNLAQWEKELAAARQRLDALTSPKRPEEKPPTGKPTEDMQRIACVVSGGQWVNGKCEKKSAGGADTTGAQLAVVKAQAEAEFKVLKEGLDLQKSALDRALDDRLVSIRDYYAEKTRIEQQAIDQELAAKQQELAAQSAVAVSGKDEAQRLRARAEVNKLEGEIAVLNMKRGEVEVVNAHAAAKAEKELADELARVRDRLAEIRGAGGGGGGEVTRARLEREYQPLIEKLQRMGDTTGVADVGRLINVEADLAELGKLERQYQTVTERMAIRERELQVQKDAGMLTETQMRRGVLELHQQTAAEVEGLIPKMQELAAATGSEEAINRVARLKVEVAGLKTAADDVATRINGDVENAFATMFEQIGTGAKSAKDAFADFARSVLATINKIAAQKIAEELFGGMDEGGGGLGGMVSGFLKWVGFASGGYVTGPGTSTSDSIPARLSAGEYVLRAEAVRRVGVDFLHALNGGLFGPRWSGPRLAFADGGLVPEVAQAPAAAPSQSVRIVNVIDPGMAADYLNSAAGEKTILNILSRNGFAVRELLR